MGKASFEETMDNFLRAGAYGQKEATKGVSASIICGKRANIGTGVCELMMDVKALPKSVRLFHDVKESMNISEFNSALAPTIANYQKAEKKMNKPAVLIESDVDDMEDEESDEEPERYISPVENTPDIVIRLTEDDFDDGKRKMMVYYGTTEMEMDSDDEDAEEMLSLSFDSKEPRKVSVRWKNGLKIGKEMFQGFDEEHGVYMPLEGVPLEEQGRFARIVDSGLRVKKEPVDEPMEPVKVKKDEKKPVNKTVKKSKKKASTLPGSLQQMSYLDF